MRGGVQFWLGGSQAGRGTEKLFVPQATQSIFPERHSPQAFLGRKVRNSAENVRLCIYMETITGLLYNRIQNHHTIEKRKNKVLDVLRDCSGWLWANTCPFSSKHMRFLLTLVIFPWGILGMLPYKLIPPPFCGSDLRFGTLYFQIHPPSCLHPLPTQTDLGPPVLLRARRIEKIPHARLPSILPSSRTLSNVAGEGSPGLRVQALCSGRRLLYKSSHLARLSGVGTTGNPVFWGESLRHQPSRIPAQYSTCLFPPGW